ncbi:MAG: hypothetical protein QOK06_2887 [Acidimicrobiaceae bacterium]
MRRRRPPTVIDLPATEVPSASAAPEASVSPPSEPAQPASSETPPPPPEPPRTEPEPPPGRRPPFAFLPEQLSWSHAGAAIAGLAGGLIVVLLLWLGGVFSSGREPVVDLSPRLAAIEKQLNDLSARPAPASVDPKAIDKAIDDIAARLARLESAQAAPRAPVTDPVVLGRLNAAENATKSLADNAAAMSRRAEATDAALRETNSRIDKLTATLTDVQTTARSAAAGSDRASRLAVAASALRNAVEHGDPFTAELAIVKPLAPDPNAVAVLEPFAVSGVPGNATLGQELAAIVRPMLRASGEPVRDGGFLDRLQANAEKLVRIRPVGEEARGDDRTAILARVEQRAAQGNISGALTELAKLPADALAPMQGWIAKAEARNRALDASRRLAADAVAALKTAP